MLRIGRPARKLVWLAMWMRGGEAALSDPPANLRVCRVIGLRAGLRAVRELCGRLRVVACEAELAPGEARSSLYLASELASKRAVAEGG